MSVFLNLIKIMIIIRFWLNDHWSAHFIKGSWILTKLFCSSLLDKLLSYLVKLIFILALFFCSCLLHQGWACLIKGSWILTGSVSCSAPVYFIKAGLASSKAVRSVSCSAPVCFVEALSILSRVNLQTQNSYFSWIII